MLSFDLVDAYLARSSRQITSVIGGRHLRGRGMWFDPSFGRGAWVSVFGVGGSPPENARVSYEGVSSMGRPGEVMSMYTAFFTEHDLLRGYITGVSNEAQFLVFRDWVIEYSGIRNLPVRKGRQGWELIGLSEQNERLQKASTYTPAFFRQLAETLISEVKLIEAGNEFFAHGNFGPDKPRDPQPAIVGDDEPASIETAMATQNLWTFDSLHRFQRRRGLPLLRVGKHPALHGVRWCSREPGESWKFLFDNTEFSATTEAEIVRAAWCDQLFHMDAPDRDESVKFLLERAAVRSDADDIRNEILDRLGDGELTALELLQ